MKNNTIYKWIVPALCVIGLSSCLKNKNEQPDFSAVTPVMELPVNSPVGDGGVNSISTSFNIADTPSHFAFYVNYAAPNGADKDIVVKLSYDRPALQRYNEAHPDDTLTVMPSQGISALPTSVTVPKGQNRVKIAFDVYTNKIDPNTAFALPVTITDASGVVISKNFGQLVLKMALKNDYDGKYSLKGYVLRAGDPVLSGFFKDQKADLVTDGTKAVTFSQIWSNGSGVGGIDGLTITIDPATNKVTMKSKANGALVNTPGYDNRYDKPTKTFYLSFYWGTGPTNRAAVDTLVYTGPR